MSKLLSNLNNQRGVVSFAFSQLMLTILIVIMATVAVISIINNTLLPQQVSQLKENAFEIDRVNMYNQLSNSLQSADEVSVSTDKTDVKDETGRVIRKEDNTTISITRTYTSDDGKFVETSTFEDTSGVLVFSKSVFREERTPSGGVNLVVKEDSSLYFDTITKLYAKKINKVCTNETISGDCYSVQGLLDVILYSNNPLDTEQAELRSRRLFHYD